MRYALFATVPVNLLGAMIFAPPFPALRTQFALPEPHPFYLWVLSGWIFFFGCCYLAMAVTQRRDRIFVAIGALGKGLFSIMLMVYSLIGTIPMFTAVSGLLDLAFAVIFITWLLTTRDD